MNPSELIKFVEIEFPLLFVTVSGAHLYGFPSRDSDYDLRGVHILPQKNLLGLRPGPETLDKMEIKDGREIDLVTHDTGKFCRLMLGRNGYVLEQLLSPLVVHSLPEHEELKEISKLCLTAAHGRHYLGFARNQWELFKKETPPRIKPLLYVYRVLLTGVHLMETGEIEANLLHLNEIYKLPQLGDLLDIKINGTEKTSAPEILDQKAMEFHQKEFDRLTNLLEDSMNRTRLPAGHEAENRMNDFLIDLRLKYGGM